jgi:hypothetical protein
MKSELEKMGYKPPWYVRDIIASEIYNNEKRAMKLVAEEMCNKLLEIEKI